MSNTQSSVPSAGDLDIPHPWQTGPAELIAYAIEHMHRGSDFDRRIAFLLLDVGVETLFKVFLTLPAGVTGAKTPPHERSRASEGNFHELVAGVRGATGGRFDQSAAHYVQYYHGLRNKLYHQGDGVTVPIRQVEGYASLAVKLLNDLIEVDFALMLTHEPSGRGTTPSESRTEPDADRSSDPEKLLERQQELQRKFFADVRRKMRLLRPALRPRSRKAVTYNCSYGSSLHGALFGWDFVDSGNILRTRLSLATGDKAYNKALFDLLFAEKVQVETQIGAALLWDRRDDAVSAQIAIDVPFNLIEASASHVRYTQEWAVARLAAFVDTFNPLLESFSAPPTPNLVQSRTEKTSVELQRGKYGHLGEHLRQAEQDGDNRISLTFSDIEDLIGYDLPDSAREHRTWWANYYGNNQAKAWLEAGWLVDGVEMSQEEVNFRQSRVALYPVVFERLLRDLKSERPGITHGTRVSLDNWYSFSAGKPGFNLAWVLPKEQVLRVELYIDTQDKQANKEAFDALLAQRADIERRIGKTLTWDRLDDNRASRISVTRPFDVADPTADRNAAISWGVETMVDFYDVFGSRLGNL